jgi:predicted  nucleic acid-binding Zn-ribbon protein
MTTQNRPPPPDLADAVRALVRLARLDGQPREHEGSQASDQRQLLISRLPPDLAALYDRLSRSGRQPILAALAGNYCNACHLRVPPQLAHAVANSWQIARCPHCGRLLYDPRVHV